MTDEEKVEARWRLEMIGRGRHPDTGKLLRPGDERTLKANEREAARMQRDINVPLYAVHYPTAMDRIMRDFEKEERDRNIALYGTSHPGGGHRLISDHGLTDPLANSAI